MTCCSTLRQISRLLLQKCLDHALRDGEERGRAAWGVEGGWEDGEEDGG